MKKLSILTLGLAFTAGVTSFGQQINGRGQPFPNVQLPTVARSAEIIGALGQSLPEVARWYGETEQSFRALIQRDKSLVADRQGQLAYVCQGIVAQGATTTTSTTTVAAGPFPDTQTFLLHSRPTSTKKIFLDFDGHTTSGTSWNSSYTSGASFTTPPFDQDGNTTSFSSAELTTIQRIWQRVVEDYSIYDVDVTTEDPGLEALRKSTSTDTAYGVRVCIGGSSYDWFKAGAGGVAYIGSFNWNSDTPCFVFPAQLGSGNEKYTAEAISHEVGHTLGLNHDGQTTGVEYYQGHGNWAPIMGVGYYKDVVQFSKGEYPSANNLQDDLVVMQNYGLTRRTDDVGDTIVNSTALSGTSVSATGLITTRTDADVFKFVTGAGTVNFATTSPSPSSNLDALLSIYDGLGNLVTSADATGLNGALTATLAAGTYYLAIDGTAPGDPLTAYNDYDSLGQYALTGTLVPTGNQPPVAVASGTPTSGTAPLSVNFSSNGSYDPDGTIASFNWDFGDGTATSSLAAPSHTYNTSGTYVASLVVTDNGGLSSTATVTINATAPVVNVFVGNITMALNTNRQGSAAAATVTVKNSSGAVVPNATVSGSWSGLATGNVSATTNSAGQVSFTSKRVRTSGTITFTVKGISVSGATYDATKNVVTSSSISVP